VSDDDLGSLLRRLTPSARDDLRRVLIRDRRPRRDLLSPDALPRPERSGQADIIDLRTMHPSARQSVWLLGDIEA
jgi:hypothetical protein